MNQSMRGVYAENVTAKSSTESIIKAKKIQVDQWLSKP